MATVGITFARPMDGIVPVFGGKESSAQLITSSGATQATTAEASNGDIATVSVVGNAVWVKVGTTPVAVAGEGYLIPSGGICSFSCAPGDKIAVIDA